MLTLVLAESLKELTSKFVDQVPVLQVLDPLTVAPIKIETILVFSEQVPEIGHEELLAILMEVSVPEATLGATVSFKTVVESLVVLLHD